LPVRETKKKDHLEDAFKLITNRVLRVGHLFMSTEQVELE